MIALYPTSQCPGRHLLLPGEVRNRVFEAVEWAPRAGLPAYDFLEADRELVVRMARGEIV